MVRSRIFARSPDGFRPWLAGVVLAASGSAWAAPTTVETLDAAVARELDAIRSDAGVAPATASEQATEPNAPRPLPELNDSAVRPVSAQQASPAPGTATGAQPAQPTAAQLEVMKKLQEMYERDGREMPSMRLKDAPNTRLPNGHRPVLVPRGGTPAASTQPKTPHMLTKPAASNEIQPASGPGIVPPAPAPHSPRMAMHSQPTPSGVHGSESAPPKKQLSFFDRLRGKRADNAPGGARTGFFGKLFGAFRKPEKPQYTGPQTPPVAPALPDYGSPTQFAAQPPAAPQALPAAPAGSLTPLPPLSPNNIAMPSPPSAGPRERDANPFIEANEPQIAITPASDHPLEDAFGEVRDADVPEVATNAPLDPDFMDPEPLDPGAPRPLDHATVSNSEGFAEIQIDTPQITTPQKSAASRYAELQRKLAERAGLGGFQGFCPVALRDRRELVDARPEFLAVHQGRTYELASAEAKARFEANPAKYAPMNGGRDVVLVAQGESDAEGNLAHAVWFKDRLYLFRSAETLRTFNSEPTKFAITD